MQNVLLNLGWHYADPQDTENYNSDTIETSGVLTRGMERSALLEIELSPVNMDTAAANKGVNMCVMGASVGGSPTGNITHQYATNLSLEDSDLHKRWLEDMKKRTTSSTKLKTAPPPLNKGRAGIYQAALRVGYYVEVAEDLRAGIPEHNCHGDRQGSMMDQWYAKQVIFIYFIEMSLNRRWAARKIKSYPIGISMRMSPSRPRKSLSLNRESIVNTSKYLGVTIMDQTGRRRRRSLTSSVKHTKKRGGGDGNRNQKINPNKTTMISQCYLPCPIATSLLWR